MKKTILTISVITLLIACSKNDDTPTPVATSPNTTTPTGGGSNADGELIAVIVEGLPSSWTASTLPSSHPSYYNAGTITNVLGRFGFNGNSLPGSFTDPNNSLDYFLYSDTIAINTNQMVFIPSTPIPLKEKWSTGIYEDFNFYIYDVLSGGLEYETYDKTIGIQNSLNLSNQNDTILGMNSQGQTTLYLQNLKVNFVVHWN